MTLSPITSVTARLLRSEIGVPVALSVGRLVGRDVVLVTVTCEDGTVGHGESFPGRAPGGVIAAVEEVLAPLVVGRLPSEAAEVSAQMRDLHLNAHSASSVMRLGLAGVDTAMWDAHGKALGLPLHQLLGGSRTTFDVYAGGFALGIQPTDELIAEGRRLLEAGWANGLKLRLGKTLTEDIARVTAVREAFGADQRLMVDANFGLQYDAGRIAPALGPLLVEWLEEPYMRPRRAQYVALRGRSPVPIAGGENLRSAEEFFDWIGAGALDVAQPDLSRVGGVTEMLRIGHVAAAGGVRFVPHISHGALNHAATLHVLSALGAHDLCEGDASPINEFRDTVFRGGVTWHDGRATLSDAPGLGVEVVDAEVERITVRA
jgi:D-galactarolactone cycloisomerase